MLDKKVEHGFVGKKIYVAESTWYNPGYCKLLIEYILDNFLLFKIFCCRYCIELLYKKKNLKQEII